MKIIFLPADGAPEFREIPNTPEACQELVGEVYEVVEITTKNWGFCKGFNIIHDDVGKNKKPNPYVGEFGAFGDAFICGIDDINDDVFADVPDGVIGLLKILNIDIEVTDNA